MATTISNKTVVSFLRCLCSHTEEI